MLASDRNMLVLKAVGTCWVSKSLIARLVQEADDALPDETGGALVGYWAADDVVVTQLISGGPKAAHGRDFFEPDWEFQQAQIDCYYARSGRLHTYLGDWHSHPSGLLRLSRRDRRTLRLIANHPDARAPNALMLLLADDGGWEVGVWRVDRSRCFSSPIRMPLVPY